MAGSGDEDAFVGQGWHPEYCMSRARGVAGRETAMGCQFLASSCVDSSYECWSLLQQLGVEALVDLPLVSWVAIRLKRGDQGAEPRRENDEISGVGCGGIGVGDACGHEDCSSGSDGFGSIGVAKGKLALQNMPGLVVGVMDVEGCRTTATPFVDFKRCAGGGEWGGVHANHPILFFPV